MGNEDLTAEIRGHMKALARTLCNGLAPGDSDWGTQVGYERRSPNADEDIIALHMGGVFVGFLYPDSLDTVDSFGEDLAQAIAGAGPAIFNLLSRVAWLESHLARTITVDAQMIMLLNQQIAQLKAKIDEE